MCPGAQTSHLGAERWWHSISLHQVLCAQTHRQAIEMPAQSEVTSEYSSDVTQVQSASYI